MKLKTFILLFLISPIVFTSCKTEEPGPPSTIMMVFMKDGAPLANVPIVKAEFGSGSASPAGATNAEGQLLVSRIGGSAYYFLDSTHFGIKSFSQEELDNATSVSVNVLPEQTYTLRLVDNLPGRRHTGIAWVEHPVLVPALSQNARLSIGDTLYSPIDTTFTVTSFPTYILTQTIVYDSAGNQLESLVQYDDLTPQDTEIQLGPF